MAYKQHFIEWFSGKQIPSYWDVSSGTNSTVSMTDEVDGGIKLTKSTTNGAWATLSFSNYKRPFSNTGCVMHQVFKASTTSGTSCDTGLSDSLGSQTNCMLVYHSDSVESGYYTLTTAGNAPVSHTATTTAIDTNWHHHKLEAKSASAEYSIEGVLSATRDSNLSQSNMMPHMQVYNATTNTFSYQFRFVEIYNT